MLLFKCLLQKFDILYNNLSNIYIFCMNLKEIFIIIIQEYVRSSSSFRSFYIRARIAPLGNNYVTRINEQQ